MEGRGGALTRASGSNFPLFLVFPVDMPDIYMGHGSDRKLLIFFFGERDKQICEAMCMGQSAIFWGKCWNSVLLCLPWS